MLVRPFLLAATLAPAAAVALPWDGTYRLSEDADCGKIGEEGGALRIAEGVLQGIDSTCRMTEPVDVLDLDATLYDMACEGEGQSWTERALLMRAAEGDGIFLAWRGYVFRYDRCPEPEDASVGTEAPADGAALAGEDGEIPEAATPEDAASDPEDGAGEDGRSDGAAGEEDPSDADPAAPAD